MSPLEGGARIELILIEVRAMWTLGRGSLQCPLYNLAILPGQNGRVKKMMALKLWLLFAFIVSRGGAETKRRKGTYGEPPFLGIPKRHVVSIAARLGIWNTEGLSPFK